MVLSRGEHRPDVGLKPNEQRVMRRVFFQKI
jgi:hypothetical protein